MFNNPDIMNQMNAMMQNPAMMSQMMAMMQNPEMMNQINGMMQNPEMMNKVNEMMQNPEMMNKVNGMMQNPEMMNKVNGMMQNTQKQTQMKGPGNLNLDSILGNNKKEEPSPEKENTFSNEDQIFLTGLNNQDYNKKEGVIRGYDDNKKRYLVYIEDIDKQISVKEENCQKRLETNKNTENNSENID